MHRTGSFGLFAAAFVALVPVLAGCDTGGVGDPCVPEEEYGTSFSGFDIGEVSAESRSFQCETRVCLVNHFQGRVSCPYGQTEAEAEANPRCRVADGADPVTVPVEPQLLERRADDSVYCSCRCKGANPNARYCECPSGFACVEVIPRFGLNDREELAGSYCVREGTVYTKGGVNLSSECDRTLANCGPE